MAAVCHAAFQLLPAEQGSSRFLLPFHPESRRFLPNPQNKSLVPGSCFPCDVATGGTNPWHGRIAEARVAMVHPSEWLQGCSGGEGRERGRKRSRDLKKSPEYLAGIDPCFQRAPRARGCLTTKPRSRKFFHCDNCYTKLTFQTFFFLLCSLFFAGWNFRFQIIWKKNNLMWFKMCIQCVCEGCQSSRSSSSRRVELGARTRPAAPTQPFHCIYIGLEKNKKINW